jgi:hypothetical protein
MPTARCRPTTKAFSCRREPSAFVNLNHAGDPAGLPVHCAQTGPPEHARLPRHRGRGSHARCSRDYGPCRCSLAVHTCPRGELFGERPRRLVVVGRHLQREDAKVVLDFATHPAWIDQEDSRPISRNKDVSRVRIAMTQRGRPGTRSSERGEDALRMHPLDEGSHRLPGRDITQACVAQSGPQPCTDGWQPVDRQTRLSNRPEGRDQIVEAHRSWRDLPKRPSWNDSIRDGPDANSSGANVMDPGPGAALRK